MRHPFHSAILGQIDNHILQSQKAEKERDGIKTQIQSMESNLQNLQNVLAKLMEETDFFGKTQDSRRNYNISITYNCVIARYSRKWHSLTGNTQNFRSNIDINEKTVSGTHL